VLVGKPERMRPLERPTHKWEDLPVRLHTWQDISHLLLEVNQGAGKLSLKTHTNPFKTAAAARLHDEIRKNLPLFCANLKNKRHLQNGKFHITF